jgi:prevent-host-death family protein
MQPSVRHVSRTDLARNTRQVIDAVLRGQTVVVAHRGQPQVAIVDIVDYRIMRIPMKSSTCSDHAVHCRSEATPASTLYSQVVDMGKGESTFRRDSPCRLSR